MTNWMSVVEVELLCSVQAIGIGHIIAYLFRPTQPVVLPPSPKGFHFRYLRFIPSGEDRF